jgi:hypothetical protein
MLDLDLSATFDTVDLQSRQIVFCPMDVVFLRTSRSRLLGLGTQSLGLDLGLGLEGLVHIPTINLK